MIRIDYIQEFVKLADYLSFSRASEDLYITQPSLSRHISLLESELGIKLVERNTRNVRLTRAGSELYKDFLQLLENYRAIQEHARLLSSGYSGHLRISTPAYWLAEHVEPAIIQFSQHHPEVKIDLDICDPLKAIDQLRSGKSDLAIGFASDAAKADLVNRKIFEERLCVVMSKTHPLAGKSSVSLDELSGDRFIGMEMDEGRSKLVSSILPLYARHGIDLSQFIIAKDFVEIGLIIRQTGAVCVLMDSLGTLGRDYLTSVPLSDDGSTLSLYLFRRKDDEDENVNAFFDLAPFIKR